MEEKNYILNENIRGQFRFLVALGKFSRFFLFLNKMNFILIPYGRDLK